ncbi:MAG: glutathione peroxidase [Pseudomonadota bacterium]
MPDTLRMLLVPLLATVVSAPAIAVTPVSSPAVANTTKTNGCPATLSHTFLRLQDEKPQSLCQYAGKVVLVVNTASYCGFTPQYKGLEALHEKYGARGLVVLGFPSNDFAQEKASNKEIAEFCENTFGVKFPMFAASSVRGDAANPLFRQLTAATGTSPKWNFYKYMVARDGKVVGSWGSTTKPEALEKEVEKQLAAR